MAAGNITWCEIVAGRGGRSTARRRKQSKEERQQELLRRLEKDPFLTDEELARALAVSVHTVRLDRHHLHLPEVRERIRALATAAYTKVKSVSGGEVFGELVDVKLGENGLSLLETTPEMGFRRTGIIRGHHLFAQANSLAVAIIDAETVLTGTAQMRFLRPVRVGERVVAKAEVVARHKRQYTVEVAGRVGEELVFEGHFLVFAVQPGEQEERDRA